MVHAWGEEKYITGFLHENGIQKDFKRISYMSGYY
jgi:hypothetical protein